MAGSSEGEAWRRNADTHKLRAEDVTKHGVESSKRPPGSGEHPGGILHQRSRLPQNPAVMAVVGFAFIAGIAYLTLYAKPKKGTTPNQAAASVADEPHAPRG